MGSLGSIMGGAAAAAAGAGGDITQYANGVNDQLSALVQQQLDNELVNAQNQYALQLVQDEISLENTAKQIDNSAARG